ncbi:hypothetical protein FD733_01715 [Pantoea sp. Eser]|nr:hypothetical protein [Pantoea sp. Eser]
MINLREMNDKIHQVLQADEPSGFTEQTAERVLALVKSYWQDGDETIRNDITQKLSRLEHSGVPFPENYLDKL